MPKVEPFEKYTSRYEEWFERNRFAYKSELQAIRALLPMQGTGVEIGVGTGRFAAPLGIKLGIEPSMSMGKIARSRGIRVIGAVAEALPFKEEQFDLVLMITVICFVDYIEASLGEAYRVLKKGGFIIVGFIDQSSPIGAIYEKHKNENVFYKEANFYSAEEVAFYMRRAGFRELAFAQTIFHEVNKIKGIEKARDGHGKGLFVIVRGLKPRA
jgi:ubiquinone/menaquinone biosynthesis C-methylase UbiE